MTRGDRWYGYSGFVFFFDADEQQFAGGMRLGAVLGKRWLGMGKKAVAGHERFKFLHALHRPLQRSLEGLNVDFISKMA